MIHVEHSIVIKSCIDKVYEIAEKIEKFPEFMPHVKTSNIIKKQGNKRQVEMSAVVNGIKSHWISASTAEKNKKIKYSQIKGLCKVMGGEWLFEKARILAVVGLEGNTFKLPAPAKGTGTRTSVLFLRKWEKDEDPLDDYSIFMAVSKKSGKDNSGEYIFLDEKGQRIKSEAGIFETAGKLRLDDDLNEIAEAFIKFAEKEKFEWWSK